MRREGDGEEKVEDFGGKVKELVDRRMREVDEDMFLLVRIFEDYEGDLEEIVMVVDEFYVFVVSEVSGDFVV